MTMIEYNYQLTDFELEHPEGVSKWLESLIAEHDHRLGELSYVFCDDEYLLKINNDFLNHDFYTDIISFDYKLGKQVNGEIYISIDRVKENAADRGLKFEDELHRVISHGVLHFLGFKDKTELEAEAMRKAEDLALESRNFI